MNAEGRKKIAELKARLEDLSSQVAATGEEIRTLAEEEREKYDNLSEGLQQAEMGQNIEAAADSLDQAASECEDGNIGGAIDSLDEVQ